MNVRWGTFYPIGRDTVEIVGKDAYRLAQVRLEAPQIHVKAGMVDGCSHAIVLPQIFVPYRQMDNQK